GPRPPSGRRLRQRRHDQRRRRGARVLVADAALAEVARAALAGAQRDRRACPLLGRAGRPLERLVLVSALLYGLRQGPGGGREGIDHGLVALGGLAQPFHGPYTRVERLRE